MQRGAEATGLPSAGRPSSQFQVNYEGRKPLFSKDHDGSRIGLGLGLGGASGGGPSPHTRKPTGDFGFRPNREGNSIAASPGGSRIPQPKGSVSSLPKRRPISLAEAFKIAQGEEHSGEESDGGMDPNVPMDGSPSPAPRPWRMRTQSVDSKLRKSLGEDTFCGKGAQGKMQSIANSVSSGTLVGSKVASSAATAGIPRMKSLDMTGQTRKTDAKTTAGSPRVGQPRSSRTSLAGTVGIPDLVPGIDDVPTLLPVERPTRIPSPVCPSPEKSFAWQVDEDFTAGDLEVSDSPRLRVGRQMFENRLSYDDHGLVSLNSGPKPANANSQNTKLSDIRSRELLTGSNVALERPTPRTYISKLDQIRARETQVEQQIPIPNRHLDRLRNTKLDEIRQREESGLSKRALAAARLQEIKELNQMTRLKTEELPRPQSSGRGLYERYNKEADAGRAIPDTPVTIFSQDSRRGGSNGVNHTGAVEATTAPQERGKVHVEAETRETKLETVRSGDEGVEDFEWVRRLARAAGSSPAAAAADTQNLPVPTGLCLSPPAGNKGHNYAEPAKTIEDKGKQLTLHRPSDTDGKPTDATDERRKPSVAFVPSFPSHRTQASTSSTKSKMSETDPTDRIEAEMKLFAPTDNQSERGSLRAPSPPLDDDDEGGLQGDDATPKPIRTDPLTLPTPRVTGAYVETPVSIKTERKTVEEEVREKPGVLGERRASWAWRTRHSSGDQDTVSEPESDVGLTSAAAAAAKRPRAKSVPRRRPPVRNSVKPPSVRDDLLQLQRAYNVEDSTFDDLDEILSGRKPLVARFDDRSSRDDFDLDFDLRMASPAAAVVTAAVPAAAHATAPMTSPQEEKSAELAALDRMSKSLRTGILSIRTAKQGIERLEGHIAQANKEAKEAEPAATQATPAPDVNKEDGHSHAAHEDQDCPSCAASPKSANLTYMHLAIPRLFHRRPQFRLTALGLLAFVLSMWWAAESTMCGMYCQTSTCPASRAPCAWSYKDPWAFGTALPIKLDQWTTGGAGREMLAQAVEGAQDWLADAQDWALGREITDVRIETLSFEEKRRHRRRLRKKGLAKPAPQGNAETRAKWDSWRQTRLAKQRAREERKGGGG